MEMNGPPHDLHCSWFVLDNGPNTFQAQSGCGGEEEDPHFCQKLKRMLSSPLTLRSKDSQIIAIRAVNREFF